MPRRVLLSCEDLRAGYLSGHSTLALARRYHCSPTTIAKYLRLSGVPLRSTRFATIAIDAAALRQAYLEERRPIAAIAAHFGVSPSTIGNKRRRYGIPPRPRRVVAMSSPGLEQ